MDSTFSSILSEFALESLMRRRPVSTTPFIFSSLASVVVRKSSCFLMASSAAWRLAGISVWDSTYSYTKRKGMSELLFNIFMQLANSYDFSSLCWRNKKQAKMYNDVQWLSLNLYFWFSSSPYSMSIHFLIIFFLMILGFLRTFMNQKT